MKAIVDAKDSDVYDVLAFVGIQSKLNQGTNTIAIDSNRLY